MTGQSETSAQTIHLGRLAWMCRRGLKELDVLIQPFFQNVYPGLDGNLQQSFVSLLQEEDADLLDWLVHEHPAPERYGPLLEQLLAFRSAVG